MRSNIYSNVKHGIFNGHSVATLVARMNAYRSSCIAITGVHLGAASRTVLAVRDALRDWPTVTTRSFTRVTGGDCGRMRLQRPGQHQWTCCLAASNA